MVTDQSHQEMFNEIIRERVFANCHNEIPYVVVHKVSLLQ